MRTAVVALCAGLSAFSLATPAAARPGLVRGFLDGVYESADASTRDYWFGQTVEANAGIIRINVPWRSTVSASGPPADPTDPSDPAYSFEAIDRAVVGAAAHGLKVVIVVFDAPDWAEGPNEPEPGQLTPNGTWKPDPKMLGDFGQALGRRYSGTFAGPSGVLPRVHYFVPWLEPNISIYLNPQWRGNERIADDRYRRMLNAFFKGLNTSNPKAEVVAGATAPFGDDGPNAIRIRPLDFMRELLCVEGHRKLRSTACPKPAKFDVYAHHPINLFGGPRKSAIDFDDINAAGDMGRVLRILRAAERNRTTGTRGRHPLFATEMFWESDPPDDESGIAVSTRRQALYIEEAFYLLWKHGVSAAILLQLVDSPMNGPSSFQTGIFFEDGTRKPSYTAFRFPFVTERQRGKRDSEVVAWAIPPATGPLQIQRKNGDGWHTVTRGQARDGVPFRTTLRIPGSATLRAMVAGETSLTWKQKAPGAARNQQTTRHRLAPRSQTPAATTPNPALAPYYEAFGG